MKYYPLTADYLCLATGSYNLKFKIEFLFAAQSVLIHPVGLNTCEGELTPLCPGSWPVCSTVTNGETYMACIASTC